MKLIALKDFYDHYAGQQLKKGEVFSVIDSRVHEMLGTMLDGSPICEEYIEPILPSKKKIKVTVNMIYNIVIVVIILLFVVFAYISQLSLALTYILAAMFVLVAKIMINTKKANEILKAIYKNQNK